MRLIELDDLKSAEPRVRVVWNGSASECEFEPPLFVTGSVAQEFTEQHRQSLMNPAPALYAISDAEVHGLGCVYWDNYVLGGEGWPGVPSLTEPAPRLFGRTVAEYFRAAAPQKSRRRVDGVSLLLARPGDHIYGHWIMDIFPIVWLALRSGVRPNYILRNDTPEYALRWLHAAAGSDSCCTFYEARSEIVEAECLLISPGLRRGNCLHEAIREYRDWFETLAGVEHSRNRGGARRLYVSRRGWTSPYRQLLNRGAIEERFRARDFEFYEPERDPIATQISVFRQARCLIGESGSALHNSMFCAPGTVVGVLGAAQRRPLIQSRLCKIFDQKIAYATGEALLRARSRDFVNIAPYLIAPAIADQFLDRLEKALGHGSPTCELTASE